MYTRHSMSIGMLKRHGKNSNLVKKLTMCPVHRPPNGHPCPANAPPQDEAQRPPKSHKMRSRCAKNGKNRKKKHVVSYRFWT